MSEEMENTTPETDEQEAGGITDEVRNAVLAELAEANGFDDVDDFAKKVKKTSKWEREVNRKASDIGRQIQQVDTPAQQEQEVDPEAAKLVARIAEQALGGRLNQTEQMATALFQQMARQELDNFAEKQGIDPDDLLDTMEDNGIAPDNFYDLGSHKRAFKAAAKIYKADNVDKEVAKKMEGMTKTGRVESVTPKRAASTKDSLDPLTDESTSFFDKMKLFDR